MEEFEARITAGLLHGAIVKDNVSWNRQVIQAKRLPEKSAKPLNYAAIDKLMAKKAKELGAFAEINRRYNQNQITKEQWLAEGAAEEQRQAYAKEERFRRSQAISQGLLAANASINQSMQQQLQPVPFYQPQPIIVPQVQPLQIPPPTFVKPPSTNATIWHPNGTSSRVSGNTIWHPDGSSSRISY
jgi:hypothetical protein